MTEIGGACKVGRLRESTKEWLIELMLLPESNKASKQRLLTEIGVEQMKRLEEIEACM